MNQDINLFRLLLGEYISPFLKSRNAVRKGGRFYFNFEETIGLIEFQKSTKSTKNKILFTINIGVFSKTIAEFLGNKKNETNFVLDACHWKDRLGSLMKVQEDVWWSLDENTSLEDLSSELLHLLDDLVIPIFKKFERERALFDFWMSDGYGGLTEFERLTNLSILVCRFGEREQIKEVIDSLKKFGKKSPSLDFSVSRQLEKLKQHNCYE